MSDHMTEIEYRYGMLPKGANPNALPLKVWRDADISEKVRQSFDAEKIAGLDGSYGDREAAEPVEYDRLVVVLNDSSVKIEVFNRGFTLLSGEHKKLSRIHRFLSVLQGGAPPSGDLSGWKQADGRLDARLAQIYKSHSRMFSSRAALQYFDFDDIDEFLEDYGPLGAPQAFATWAILHYRPTAKSRTLAETMLETGLPEAEGTLLRAMIEGYPSLYRVAAHDAKAWTITLEDVLLGGTVTVHDQVLSGTIKNDVCITAIVFAAGDFHFLRLAGPPMGALMVDEAVEILRDEGVELTREGLRRDAHKFGWLWDWIDEWDANRRMPQLRNTDNEAIVWHTATFSMADGADTRKRLAAREDTDHDEVHDEFVWLRGKGKGVKEIGGPVLLGKIAFVGDKLELEVNSAERLAKARKWLEEMPGVAFLKVKTKTPEEMMKEQPGGKGAPGREPLEATPDLRAAAQAMLDEHYREWVDMPLPALDDKTPREACQTPAGRQRVAVMIRTMPEPMADLHVAVPRDAIRKELGLPSEAPTRHPSFPAPPAAPLMAASTTGRNAPCPCGSGKKYKKCCGR